MNEIVDEILIRLNNDPTNEVNFSNLKKQIEQKLEISIDENTEKSVLDLLLLHDLCEKSFPIATFVLKLTNKGRIAATKGIEKYLQE
ncbi:MAG: hypothetical protein ABIJ97_03330, partial [Bacteroidota bacterium]